MRKDGLLGGLAFLCALAFGVPAGAVTINDTDHVFFAEVAIKIENRLVTHAAGGG